MRVREREREGGRGRGGRERGGRGRQVEKQELTATKSQDNPSRK